MKTGVKSLSDIVPAKITRISTTIDELDWQYGYTGDKWGLPLGKLSLWSGVRGIGKSRTAICVARRINEDHHSVFYNSGELPPEQFAAEKLSGYKSNNFYLANLIHLSDLVSTIISLKPNVAFIDSVNTIIEYKGGRGAQFIVDGDKSNKGLRVAAEIANCHIVLLSQLNADGSVKGGSSLPHYVDIEARLNWYDDITIGSVFMLIIDKNRYGMSSTKSVWRHENTGAICQSERRLEDKIWNEQHCKVKREKEELGVVVERRGILGKWMRFVDGILR